MDSSFGFEKRMDAERNLITGLVPEVNAQLILDFIENYPVNIGVPTKVKKMTRLRLAAKAIGKPLNKLTLEDLHKINRHFSSQKWSSIVTMRKTLKNFLRWMDKKRFLELIESQELSCKTPSEKQSERIVKPERFWSEEEEKRYLLESLKVSKRQGAFAAIWLGTGLRPGELLDLKKSSIQVIKGVNGSDCIDIRAFGKTGERIVRLHPGLSSYVLDYLKSIEKLPEQAFLWSVQYNPLKPEHYEYARRVHNEVCASALIPKIKDWTLKGHRKQHATWAYKVLGERMAEKRLGHTVGTKVARYYSGISDSDANQRYEEALGIKQAPKKSINENLQMRSCFKCGKTHLPTEDVCQDCGLPLDAEKFAGLKTMMLDMMKQMWVQNGKSLNPQTQEMPKF